jgi:hypothetical protein
MSSTSNHQRERTRDRSRMIVDRTQLNTFYRIINLAKQSLKKELWPPGDCEHERAKEEKPKESRDATYPGSAILPCAIQCVSKAASISSTGHA